MKQYLDLLKDILDHGVKKSDRTGTGTISVFGRQMRFDLEKGFPAMTTKKLYIRSIIHELLWFLKGGSNIEYLAQNDVHIWDEWPFRAYLIKIGKPVPDTGSSEWNEGIKAFAERIKTDAAFAKEYGELGPVYGYQWRSWPTPHGGPASLASLKLGRSGPTGGHIDQIAQVLEQLKKNPDDRRMIVSAWNVADIEEMAKAGLPPCHCLFQFYVAD